MRRTRQGRPEALVSKATLLASLPVVKIRRQSTAFSMTDVSTCNASYNSIIVPGYSVYSVIMYT